MQYVRIGSFLVLWNCVLRWNKTLQRIAVVQEEENMILLHALSQNPSEKPYKRFLLYMRTRTWSAFFCLTFRQKTPTKESCHGPWTWGLETWSSFTLCLKNRQKKTLQRNPMMDMHGTRTFVILRLKFRQEKPLERNPVLDMGTWNLVLLHSLSQIPSENPYKGILSWLWGRELGPPSSYLCVSNSVRKTFKRILSWTWGRELGPPSSFVSKSVGKTLQKVPVVQRTRTWFSFILCLKFRQKKHYKGILAWTCGRELGPPSSFVSNSVRKTLQGNPVMDMGTRTWSSFILVSQVPSGKPYKRILSWTWGRELGPSSYVSQIRSGKPYKVILSWTWGREALSSFILCLQNRQKIFFLQKVPVVHEDENLVLPYLSQIPSEKT